MKIDGRQADTTAGLDLLQLAMDIVDGLVFTDRQCGDRAMVTQVFMPLLFIDQETAENWARNPETAPFLFYAYLKDAGPLAVNGHPMFDSCSYLTRQEVAHLVPMIEEYEGLRRKFVAVHKSGE